MISKELLEIVLDTSVDDTFYYNDNLLWFESDGREFNINLYELAHKCKEWAFRYKYDFEVIRIKSGKNYGKIFIRIHTIHNNICNGEEFYPFNEELEGIFKACDWILKEINK